jgi:hypothetical protein
LDNDGAIEFIFIDLNELSIYSRQKKNIGTYKWDDIIAFPPQIIQMSSKASIGVISGSQLYLLDSKATLFDSFPMNGSSPFAVKTIDGKPSLVVSTDGGTEVKIYNQ